MMQLYAPSNDVRALKVLVTASYAHVNLEVPKFVVGVDDKTEWFLSQSPLGRYPLLITPDGPIIESNAICRYIANSRPMSMLCGETFHQHGETDMWMDICTYEIELPLYAIVQGEADAHGVCDIEAALVAVDKHLLTHTYFVGENITVADVSMAVVLKFGLMKKVVPQMMNNLPNLKRWFDTISTQPEFASKVECLTETVTETVAETVTETVTEAVAETVAETVSVCSLDEWKRCYSNSTDLVNHAMKWFWDEFNWSCWSFWYMKYDKLETECKLSYVTSNQLGGFMQRLEPSFRKVCFGVIDVIGEGSDYDIVGLWMFQGDKIPMELQNHPSYEYHQWRKLNVDTADDKKLVNYMWSSKTSFDGRPIVTQHVWK